MYVCMYVCMYVWLQANCYPYCIVYLHIVYALNSDYNFHIHTYIHTNGHLLHLLNLRSPSAIDFLRGFQLRLHSLPLRLRGLNLCTYIHIHTYTLNFLEQDTDIGDKSIAIRISEMPCIELLLIINYTYIHTYIHAFNIALQQIMMLLFL